MQAATYSRGIAKITHLEAFLDVDNIVLSPSNRQLQATDFLVGWGRKSNTEKAILKAQQHRMPYLTLEDGFIRSIGLGREGKQSLSMIVDQKGIYYDATKASDLENMLNDSNKRFSSEQRATAQTAITLILKHQISKYNSAKNAPEDLFPKEEKHILIVDQVANDASLAYGAPGFNLDALISAAIDENPGAKIHIKLHPENIAGLRAGLFQHTLNNPRLHLISEDYNPYSILKFMDKIYVATSQMGFEALMLGKKVICFGSPYYAGWGLTDDRVTIQRRFTRRSFEELFIAAYILYSRYVNPLTGKRCEILEALQFLITQIRYEQLNQSDIYCFGIRHWTRVNINPFLQSNRNKIHYVKNIEEAYQAGFGHGSQVVIWGTRHPEGLNQLEYLSGKPALIMEDGFLRSVGLGSDFVRPSSLVLDQTGIYFDPSKPSDLEIILKNKYFSEELLQQAKRVRHKIIEAQLTKYNYEPNREISIPAPENTTVILVPGQVEDDASIRLGCCTVNTNLGLLEEVRKQNPSAYIIYKPHPDVSSGNRRGKVNHAEAEKYCNQVIDAVNIASLLDLVHEVHTMTSLVGFEGLLRALKVVTYGQPFYAGWGLTTDRFPIPRRTRKLTLDQLVAGTLLQYPRYFDWESGYFTDCETIINKLIDTRAKAEKNKNFNRLQPGYAERQVRKLGKIIKGLSHAH